MNQKPIRPIIYEENYALVELTRGKFSKIDIEDAERVGQFNWFYKKGYAARSSRALEGSYCHQYLHRFINNTPDGFETDHIDGDPLNNRRTNLRPVTRTQNLQNMRKRKTLSSSKFKGVYFDRHYKQPWKAQIAAKGERIYLGNFPSEEAAARAYDYAAGHVFGEYARLNLRS